MATAALVWASVAALSADPTPTFDRVSAFEDLKNIMHTLPAHEATARLTALRDQMRTVPAPPHQDKVEHVVVLLMENHAADNMFGCMDLPGFDGVPAGGHTIPVDPSDPTKGNVTMKCGTGEYVCPGGPSYNLFSGKFKPGTNSHTYPYDEQSDLYSGLNGARGVAVSAFSAEQLPIKATMAKEFGVFNKMYCAVPSASTPNHLMIQSATSCGLVDNIRWKDCGGPTATFPQMTIFDSLYVNDISFTFYMNSTCGIDGNPACSGEDPNSADAGSTIFRPDVAMSGVGRYKEYFKSMDLFYENAANGTLPALSWMLPPLQACDHPCYDVAKGERLLKDIYEALRNGPGWEKTLFFVTYDDAGAYYDHVIPPFEGVPNDEAPCHLRDQCSPTANKFDFQRLGLRTTAMLISPLVAKGSVFQEPTQGPSNTSQYDHTSVPATLKSLFNLSGFLTKRDAWAGTFDELLLDTPRTDTPATLPDAPKPAKPWTPPPNDTLTHHRTKGVVNNHHHNNNGHVDTVEIDAYTGPEPQHCSLKEQECTGPNHMSMKQRNAIKLFADTVPGLVEPDLDSMSVHEADQWLHRAWARWLVLDDGTAVKAEPRSDL